MIRIPAEFVMIARVFLSLGGLFQHYRPRIDYSRPLLAVLAERSRTPAVLAERSRRPGSPA